MLARFGMPGSDAIGAACCGSVVGSSETGLADVAKIDSDGVVAAVLACGVSSVVIGFGSKILASLKLSGRCSAGNVGAGGLSSR